MERVGQANGQSWEVSKFQNLFLRILYGLLIWITVHLLGFLGFQILEQQQPTCRPLHFAKIRERGAATCADMRAAPRHRLMPRPLPSPL